MAATGETSAQMAVRDPDVRLMLRVRDLDDAAAFASLVERFHPRIVTVLRHIVGSADEAEDLAQEAFLRVYRFRERYHPKAKFSTWLFAIANNLAINVLRSRQRSKLVPLALNESGSLAIPPSEAVGRDRNMPAHDRLQQQELAGVVRQALELLNERQRMAVVLHKFEDMSYAEIAEVMEMSVKSVKSLLCRARENLRLALREYLETETTLPIPPLDGAGNNDADNPSCEGGDDAAK